MAYSPQELKKAILRGFSILTGESVYEKEPEMGLFDPKIQTLVLRIFIEG
jgi:hypothetical protein